jgi:glyoxylase-like metal-dependent hydrolase (beta-lactamase superfamily II)
MSKLNLGRSEHFALHPLGEDVFAAIAKDGGAAICNSGVIDLGRQVVVFDTFLTPQAALDLRETVVDVLGRAPQIVINSHYHNDHIWGNQVFAPDAQILCSTRTSELIATAGVDELSWYASNSAGQLASHREQYAGATDAQEREDELLWMGEYAGVVEALPHLEVCMPSITFKDRLEIHGTKHTADLITYEGGHTGSDTVLYLPDQGIVFMSDLLFVRFHPYLAEGNPVQLLRSLKELSALDAHCFVPGHGPVGGIDDLGLLIGYIEHCLETAQMLVTQDGSDADRVTTVKVPERYQHWRLPQFYRASIRSMCQQLSAKLAVPA